MASPRSSLSSRLARALLREHPTRAAAVLERGSLDEVAATVEPYEPADVGAAVRRMAPHASASLLSRMGVERAAAVVATLPTDVATAILRRVEESPRAALLDRLPEESSAALRSVLGFSEGTAGALMDVHVLAVPDDLTAREAMRIVRATPERARYNVYVVDRDGVLVGVLNLRELLLARPRTPLEDLMRRHPQTLRADDGRMAIVEHPGWREVHSLPVVDERGRYLGAVRYRTLRALESELLGRPADEKDTGQALGEVFSVGATALLEAIAGPGRNDRR